MNWITALGLIAAFCTSTAFLPQALKTIRLKETKDLSLWTYILMSSGTALWLTYGILIKNLPIIAANIVSCSLATTILALKIRYK